MIVKFQPIEMSGAYRIGLNVLSDDRGSFARTWCADMFSAEGIDFAPAQGNQSITRARGTLRGLHFQREPEADAKIVRCAVGRLFDVIIDLRQNSLTTGRAYVNELTADGGMMLYVPAGFAHGFQTLTDNVVVEYLMGANYAPELYDGLRFDDPLVGVRWPLPIAAISPQDERWPPLSERMPWLVKR